MRLKKEVATTVVEASVKLQAVQMEKKSQSSLEKLLAEAKTIQGEVQQERLSASPGELEPAPTETQSEGTLGEAEAVRHADEPTPVSPSDTLASWRPGLGRSPGT